MATKYIAKKPKAKSFDSINFKDLTLHSAMY